MKDPRMPWIYHADMFRRPLQYRLSICAGLQQTADRQIASYQMMEKQLNLQSNPTQKSPVVQIFWRSRELNSESNVSRLGDGGLPWATLLPIQEEYNFLSSFLATCVAAFPLQDALLPITGVVTGLVKWMQYLTNTDDHKVGMSKESTIGMAAAECFALAASELREKDTTKQVEVAPLPEELFTTGENDACSYPRTSGSGSTELETRRMDYHHRS
jgi:hypothetical protein